MKNFKIYMMLIVLFFVASKCLIPKSTQTNNKIGTKPILTEVVHVIDGDTIIVKGNRKVRLIGVDTPELRDSPKLTRIVMRTRRSPEFIKKQGREAYKFTRRLCDNANVRLEFDEENSRRNHLDDYNRLLAYVYVLNPGGEIFLNAEILKAGYGEYFRKYRYKYKYEFQKYEQDAKQNRVGLWE